MYKQRAVHTLNHQFIPNRTGEICFFSTCCEAQEDNNSCYDGCRKTNLFLTEKLAKSAKRVIDP